MPCSFLWGHHNIHLTFSWLLTVRECLTVEFLCAVSYLSWALCSLSVPDRTEIKEMGFLYRISFIPFPYDERDYLLPSFDMDCLLALWPLLLLISLVTCKVWSFDLYLKKLHCNMVYISTQNSIKHPVPPETWVPVSFSLSLSLSGWFPGAPRPAELFFLPGLPRPLKTSWGGALNLHEQYKPCLRALLVFRVTQSIVASFFLSLSYRWLWTTRLWSIKGSQHLTTNYNALGL